MAPARKPSDMHPSVVWCSTCGGQGFIDEADAERLGLDLGDARTQPCPTCRGSGASQETLKGCAIVFAIVFVAVSLWLAVWFTALSAWRQWH